MNFSIEDGSEIEIKVSVEKGKIIAEVNGHVLETLDDSIPENFHIGITACEGENKFYNFAVN